MDVWVSGAGVPARHRLGAAGGKPAHWLRMLRVKAPANRGSPSPMSSNASRATGDTVPVKLGFIVGPTGIGKTALTVEVAQRLGAEIVNADSRQVYRGMDIGTAKPGAAELARVRHHLVDIRSPASPWMSHSFALWHAPRSRRSPRAAVRYWSPGVVGFTYACCATASSADLGLRPRSAGNCSKPRRSMESNICTTNCAVSTRRRARRLEPHDLYRIVRAIEVFRLTGVTISQHQAAHGFARPEYETLTVGLRMDRERLYQAIEQRFDAMMAAGLVEEVQTLLAAGYTPHTPPLSTIGYKHIAAYLLGEHTLEAAVETAKRDTRRLAKRQLTWFRRDPEIIWIDAGSGAEQAYTLFVEFFRGAANAPAT